MTVHARCQECNTTIKADDTLQGTTLSCPNCKTNVTVPIIVGPCPACDTPLIDEGRHRLCATALALLAMGICGLLASLLYSVGIESFHQVDWPMVAAALGLALLAAIASAMQFTRCFLRCPQCQRRFVSKTHPHWNSIPGANRCPCCIHAMVPGDALSRIIGVFMALASLFFLYVGIISFRIDPFPILIVLMVYFASGIYLGLQSYRRVIARVTHCKHCGFQQLEMRRIEHDISLNGI